MKIQWTFIFALIFALIIAIFAVINVEPVQVNFLFAQTSIPLILVILGSTLLGGLIAALVGGIRQFALHRTIRQLERQVKELEAAKGQEASPGSPLQPKSASSEAPSSPPTLSPSSAMRQDTDSEE